MPITFLTGGIRSGKSRLAARMASAETGPVVVIATATRSDPEMIARIEAHRSERSPDWAVTEEPRELEGALRATKQDATAIVDCLTLWVSNLMEAELTDEEILERSDRAVVAAKARSGDTIVISNEVGSGIVPMNALARRYEDVLGAINSRWASAASSAFLVVAGRVLPLQDPG